MAPLSSRLVVSLVDRASAGARSITRSLGTMRAAAAGSTPILGRAAGAVGRYGRRLSGIANGPGMGAMGAAAGTYAFLNNELQYQEAMNRTQAILNQTDENAFKPHRDLVVDLAKKYPATSAEIAKGASELAMAGMSMEQVNEVLEATVQGSMASGESIKTVGQGVTDVIMGLGQQLTGENFGKINDLLAAAGTSYAQDYTEFLAGFAKTAPIARMLGLDAKDLAGYLGILADANFKAEKGGTAFRTSLINLAAPGNKAQAWLRHFKVDLTKFREQVDEFQLGGEAGGKALSNLIADSLGLESGSGLEAQLTQMLSRDGAFQNVPQLKRRLVNAVVTGLGLEDAESTEKVSEAVNSFIQAGFTRLNVPALLQKLSAVGFDTNMEAMKELFGKRFVAQMGVILNSLRDGSFAKKFEGTFLPRIEGAVKRFSDILLKGLPGAVRRLGGAFDGFLRTAAASGAIETIAAGFEKLTSMLNRLSETNPQLLKFGTLAVVALGALAPIGFAISGIATGLTALGAALGLVNLPFLAFAGAAAFIVSNLSGVSAFLSGVTDGFVKGLGPAAPILQKVGEGIAWIAETTLSLLGPLGESEAKWRSWGETVGGIIAWPIRQLGKLIDLAVRAGGALGFGSDGSQKAAASDAGGDRPLNFGAGLAGALGGGGGGSSPAAVKRDVETVTATVRSAASEIRDVMSGVDLRAEGERIMNSLAAGMRAGIPSIRSAASAGAAAAAGNALRGAYSDGAR